VSTADSAVGALARESDTTTRGATAVLGAGMLAAHVASYAFVVASSRVLGPSGYGAVAALVAVLMVAGVPGLALQAVVAGRVARTLPTRRLLTWTLRVGLAVGALVLLTAPLLRDLLALPGLLPVAALAAALAAQPVLSTSHGLLQGAGRLHQLAALLVLGATTKLVAGVGLVLLGHGAAGAMGGLALAHVVEAVVALRVVRPVLHEGEVGELLRDLAVAVVGLAAVFTLANADVLVARARLTGEASGLYAVGAVAARVAFWLPQFLVVAGFRHLAEAERRAAQHRSALVGTVAIGVLGVLAAAVLGPDLVVLVFGEAYGPVGGLLWAFTLLGTAVAVVHLAVQTDVAARRRGAVVIAVAGTTATLLVAAVVGSSTERLLMTVLAGAVATATASTLATRRADT
jgi:O-antigen/teichoic acid export membrane protein